jgi:hypothetical protein
MLLDEVMDWGAVGTIQEIRDGARAANNDEFGGATSQAWSLAELLRNVVQDYAGLKVDLTAEEPVVVLRPRVPVAWPSLAVHSRIGTEACRLEIDGGTVRLLWAGEEPLAATVYLENDGERVQGKWEETREQGKYRWAVVFP